MRLYLLDMGDLKGNVAYRSLRIFTSTLHAVYHKTPHLKPSVHELRLNSK